MTARTIGRVHERWFEQRGISLETVARFEIYTGSGKRVPDGKGGEKTEVVPDPNGNILVFPFLEHGVEVTEKYRAPGKRFWQREGGKRTFWNSDILDDPALADGSQALVITEGEPDGLTAIDCGWPFTVSVPDGAPAVPKNEDPDQLAPIDPQKEAEGKFEFLYNNRDRLKRVKRFIIAVDADRPGRRLAAELVRRLSASRCAFVTYPPDPIVPDEKAPEGKRACKDLNEVRMHFGPEAVTEVLNSAKPYPVKGLYRLSDFPDLPPLRTFETGWSTVDQHFKPFLGSLVMVLGIPGHGKSVMVANLLVNLSERYGWRSAIFSPEMPTKPQMRELLRKIRLRRPPFEMDGSEITSVDEWISDRFVFIAADPFDDEDEPTLDWILDRATDAVIRDGIRALLLDPWNEIEQLRQRGETQTEYIGRTLRAINRFRRKHDVMVIICLHPTKEVGKEGKSRPPTPYDTDGSAQFYNKADHFLIMHWPDENVPESLLRVAKVKFDGTGRKGTVRLKFDELSSRYELLPTGEPADD